MKNEDTGITRRDFLRSAATAGAAAVVASAVGVGEAEAGAGQFRNITPYDMRRSELLGVRAGTAEVSRDRIAIAAYGDDQTFIDAIERAVLYIRSQNVPVDVVWGDNVHAGGHNAIDVYIEGNCILPGVDWQPPFRISSDPNDIAYAITDSFNTWKSLAQAPGPAPNKG